MACLKRCDDSKAGNSRPRDERKEVAKMDHRDVLHETGSGDTFVRDDEICATRRGLLLAPLLAALPLALLDSAALAGQINSSETQVTLADAIKWSGWINGFPPHSGEMATLYGGLDKPGPYLVLMKWYPGYMTGPPTYPTDPLSLVTSGTRWLNNWGGHNSRHPHPRS